MGSSIWQLPIAKRFSWAFLCFAVSYFSLTASTAFAAQNSPSKNAPHGQRFLFIVETSTAMLSFEHGGRQAVFDLIYSGLAGQMQAGDTVGIWTFGKDLHAGVFPMQVWNPEQNLQLASLIGLFLKNQHQDDQTHFERVVPALLSLIKSVKDLNVLLVSGGGATWQGTGFVQEINRAYQSKLTESRSALQPVITTLTIRGGEVAGWSVTLPGEPISFPKATVPTKVTASDGAQKANPAAGSNVVSNGPAAAAKPLAKNILILSKPKPVTVEPTTKAASSLTNSAIVIDQGQPAIDNAANPVPTPAPSLATLKGAVTNSESKPDVPHGSSSVPNLQSTIPISQSPAVTAAVAIATTKAAVTNIEARQEASMPPPSIPNSNRQIATSNLDTRAGTAEVTGVSPAPGLIAAVLPGPLPVAARERPNASNVPAADAIAAPIAMASPPEPLFGPRKLFLIGIAFTIVALALAFVLLRFCRSAAHPSFITRSFDRHRP